MRKVGLWNFYEMEGTEDGDASAPASGPVSSATPEAQDDQAASASSAPSATPRRMKLRSQDTIHPDQASIDHKKLDHMCAHIIFIITKAALFCVNGMCYRVTEPPLLWLCVLELEIHQASVKSYQAPLPGAKGQLETEDKGKTPGPMLLSPYLSLTNGSASHQSSAL